MDFALVYQDKGKRRMRNAGRSGESLYRVRTYLYLPEFLTRHFRGTLSPGEGIALRNILAVNSDLSMYRQKSTKSFLQWMQLFDF